MSVAFPGRRFLALIRPPHVNAEQAMERSAVLLRRSYYSFRPELGTGCLGSFPGLLGRDQGSFPGFLGRTRAPSPNTLEREASVREKPILIKNNVHVHANTAAYTTIAGTCMPSSTRLHFHALCSIDHQSFMYDHNYTYISLPRGQKPPLPAT